MPNKNLQFGHPTDDELNSLLQVHHPQILIRNAYIDELQRWRESIVMIENNIIKYANELESLKRTEKNKSFWIVIWHKITKQDLVDRKKIRDLQETIVKLKDRFNIIRDNPPNTDMYNLAMFGSNLFSVR